MFHTLELLILYLVNHRRSLVCNVSFSLKLSIFCRLFHVPSVLKFNILHDSKIKSRYFPIYLQCLEPVLEYSNHQVAVTTVITPLTVLRNTHEDRNDGFTQSINQSNSRPFGSSIQTPKPE